MTRKVDARCKACGLIFSLDQAGVLDPRDDRSNTRGLVPEPALIRTPNDAEQMACDWMKYLGYDDAAVTQNGPDGGIDVSSSLAIAQVKTETKPIGRPAIQSLRGAAACENRTAFFFSLSGYTREAAHWADRAGVALFIFNYSGEVEGFNGLARELLSENRDEQGSG